MKLTILLFALIALISCHDNIPDNHNPNKKQLPAFNILLVDSTNTFNTQNIPAGKQAVFFYFDPDCEYCKLQTESIISVANDLKQTSFYFISDYPVNALKQYNSHYKLGQYQNIVVGTDINSYFGNYYRPSGIPCLAFFGKDRQLKKLIIGNASPDSIKSNLN